MDLVVLNDIRNIYLTENIMKDGVVCRVVVKDHKQRVDFKALRKYIYNAV